MTDDKHPDILAAEAAARERAEAERQTREHNDRVAREVAEQKAKTDLTEKAHRIAHDSINPTNDLYSSIHRGNIAGVDKATLEIIEQMREIRRTYGLANG